MNPYRRLSTAQKIVGVLLAVVFMVVTPWVWWRRERHNSRTEARHARRAIGWEASTNG